MAPIHPSTDPSKEAVNHGMALDPENKRVQCCYCGKVVPGFNRLQHHLGGIRGNIVECPDVPEEVKKYFKNSLVAVKVGRLVKEVGELDLPGPSSKRRCIPNGESENNHTNVQNPRILTGLPSTSNAKPNVQKPRPLTELPSTSNAKSNVQKPRPLTDLPSTINAKSNVQKPRRFTDLPSTSYGKSNVQKPRLLEDLPSTRNGRSDVLRACSSKDSKEGLSSASIASKRYIGRFFFENAIDFSAVTSPTFKGMMEIFPNKGEEMIHSIPSVNELKGWVLEDELNDIRNYVNEIRLSWVRTGCSVLLDGWTDKFGRDIINVVVDCPKGPTYLCSADVSPSKGANTLQLFLESVLEEVGIQNVVQIVAHTWSDSLEAVSKQLIEKYRSLFWSVSGTYCLSLILDKISGSNPIKVTLEKAKTITQFIYGRSEALKLLRRHIGGHDLVRPSKIKAATPFLTLENFLVEKSNLEHMFTSSEWLDSRWAASDEGKMVSHLILDSTFWDDVLIAVKVCIPLVKAMSLTYGDAEPHLGYIYETMDQIKETISDEFGGKKSMYMQYWAMIDEIWNTILYSPLHAAGYYLNPRLYFTDNFYSDSEVASGLFITFVRMVNGQPNQDMLCDQVQSYATRRAYFQLGIDNKDSLHPAAWWTRYGGRCPELQKVAVRILSQTCNGAEIYGLNRDLAEKLLSDADRNSTEQQNLLNFTYLHYNMKLMQFKLGPKFDIVADQIDPTDDWIVDPLGPESGPQFRTFPGSGRAIFEVGGPSGVLPKVEP